jgi:hypothetical protein
MRRMGRISAEGKWNADDADGADFRRKGNGTRMIPMGRISAEGEWNVDDTDGTDFRGREMERG